ncbi:hypothetical protein Tco_1391868 [Tanacetum coccineum]
MGKVDHFHYLNGDEKQISDINFEGTTLRIDIRDQAGPLVHDESNESSDAYCSSDDEDLGFVEFHTKTDDDIIIKTLTTNDPFLNKLCSNNGHFRGFIDEPVNANVERVVEDKESIDHEFNVKQGMTYLRHDPTQDRNKIKHVLGMRFEHSEQLKLCLANYGVVSGYQLWYTRNDWRQVLVFYSRDVETGWSKKRVKRKSCVKGNSVITRSKANNGEGTSKSPQTTTRKFSSGD